MPKSKLRDELRAQGFWRVSEAALVTGIPQSTIYRRLEAGDVKGRRVGGVPQPAREGVAAPRRKGAGIWYVHLTDLKRVFGLAESAPA